MTASNTSFTAQGGSVVLGRLQGDGKARAWMRAHLDYPYVEWCLIWPFALSRNGYAYFDGGRMAAHRVMCEHVNGTPPTPQHHAAHSCGNGAKGCVNPRHLSWKTASENQQERWQQSGSQPKRKLTLEQVDEIRALQNKLPVLDIAARFNVSETNVRDIHAGRLWRKDRTDQRIFTSEEIIRICNSPFGVVGVVNGLAKEFGVSTATIHRIRNRQSYQHVQPADLVLKSEGGK